MINAKNLHYHPFIKVVKILVLFQTYLGYFILSLFGLFFIFLKLIISAPYKVISYSVSRSYRARGSKVVFFGAGLVSALVFVLLPFQVYTWYRNLPRPEMLIELGNNRSTRILDRNGRLLYEIYVDRKYNPVVLENVPEHVMQATLAIEDDAFYSHYGFRVDSMMRAAKASVFEDNLQGASTITQQLVKNVLLTSERTIPRKIKELVLSVLVEQKYTKDEILELYMNNIPYGGTAWGIEAAAQKFFGKHVSELTLAQASMLAGLPSAPSAYSPLRGDASLAKERQRLVLNRMVKLGNITQEEADAAFAEELVFVEQSEFMEAPHFVSYVRDFLEDKYGKRFVELGGLTVKTTLNLDLQEKVQEIVREGVESSAHLNISNGAALVLDSRSSEILAYVGSIDYFKEDWGAYDVVTAYRQPGSSIKPVTYALAFERGLTPATVIEDKPIAYKSFSEVYRPVNYDGKFHGEVTLRQALANSYNVPAVKLVSTLGPDGVVSLGKDLGLKGWEVDGSYGLSITLGGKEVRLLDHANVYATFARGGMYKEVVPILSVRDSYGYEIYRVKGREDRVLDEEVSYLVTSILSDNVARTPAFGSNSDLVVPGYTVAVKTGTTDNKRDNWTLGYTPSYTVGVWVGNNDNTPMNPYLSSGLSGASSIWNNIMREVLVSKPNELFEKPEGVFVKFDEKCGRSEFFVKGSSVPEHLCKVDKDKDKVED